LHFTVFVSRSGPLEWREPAPISSYELEARDAHAAAALAVERWQSEQRTSDVPGHVTVEPSPSPAPRG
jgi:hypothetical protein